MPTAHFRVTGEGLTRIARDGMLSERPSWAWRLLVDGLSGVGVEVVARAVLEGSKRLAGDETTGITVVDDDSNDSSTAAYLQDLRYVYAGRVRVHGRWWRPRARVTSFGQEDVGGSMALKRLRGPGSRALTPREVVVERCSHYAGPEERVFEVISDEQDAERKCGNPGCTVCATRGYDYVIFEPCSEPPHWRKEVTDPTVAMHDFRAAGRHLEDDGYMQRYHEPTGQPLERECSLPEKDAVDLYKRRCRELEEEKKRRQLFLDECTKISAQVRSQAAGDVFLLKTKDGRSWSVPRAPFENWALGRTSLRRLAAKWKPVSHSGMKLANDDPFHTDWMLGSGIGISHDSYWDEAIRDAVTEAACGLQERLGSFTVHVIVDAGAITGVVGEDVLVVPDMHPDRVDAMLAARAVITEAGGAGAHLAQVGAEHSKTIVRVADAVTRYQTGDMVRIDPSAGRVEVIDVH